MLLDLDEIPGAPPISEPDAFLRAENYVRIEQDIPQLRFDPKDPRIQLRNKRRSSSFHPGGSTHKAPRCRHEFIPLPRRRSCLRRRDPEEHRESRAERPPCFSAVFILRSGDIEIIADIRRTPLTSRLSEIPLKKPAFLKQHLRFALDDLILCKSNDDRVDRLGKFGFSWEGPYRVARVVKPGIYQLEDNLGNTSERLWSSTELRKFHD
ncbi:unnamed protein product [Microthlaspi erraticum]|uniref:Uncharacterized protein n=1 Tax=Microthlaspi erraticum TaxID=1685480 RepID=A0A6D2JNZ3_9BRAS|nr:unnamed protein product [Microthlaspi erraticum]